MKNAGLGFVVGFVFLVFSSLNPAHAESGPAISNLEDAVRELGLRNYYSVKKDVRPIKVAVLDNGFSGFEKELGKTLPTGTTYHAGPVAPPSAVEKHGLVMAQILYALMTDSGKAEQFTPELHLYNTYGYSNFKAAVEDCIRREVDLILYSQVWEYGGNWDGRGFINQIVTQAVERGILWINASGDFGDTTFNSAIRNGTDDWLELPGPNQSVEIRCEKHADRKTCPLRLVLSWNDFKDDVNLGTTQDLDLVLTDDTLTIIQTSTLIQTNEATDRTGYSRYPREILTADLKPGLYFARVKNRSRNFGSRDRLRLTASGDLITMPRHDKNESLLAPADHPEVIAVGASDSEKSSLSRQLKKPQVLTRSLIKYSETEQYKGTSTSAAMAAAYFGILKSLHRQWDRVEMIDAFLSRGSAPGQGLTLAQLGFTYTGRGCFLAVDPRANRLPAYVLNALNLGGTMIETTAGRKIFYEFDPIRLMPASRRIKPDDMLVIGPGNAASPAGTTGLYPRSALYQLPSTIVEILQTPSGQKVCGK